VLAAQFLEPARRLLCFFHVETSRVQHLFQRHFAETRRDDLRARIQRRQHALDALQLRRLHQIGLVQDDHVSELDLIHEQIHHATVVRFVA